MFDRAGSDRYKRIWIEQKVLNTEYLLNIQQEILRMNPTFIPYEENRLHLTVFHFGVPDELYSDLKRHNPSLQFSRFLGELEDMLLHLKDLIPHQIEATPIGLDSLGYKRRPKIAMILEKNSEIENYRSVVMTLLISFLHNLDLVEPEKVFSQSRNLYYSLNKDYVPHVTVGMFEKRTTLNNVEFEKKSIILSPSEIIHYHKGADQDLLLGKS